MRSPITGILTETAILVASHTLAAQSFEKFWKSVSPKLSEGVSYFEKNDIEQLHAEKTILEAITFRDAKLTRIINGCLAEFLSSDILVLVDKVQAIQDKQIERKRQINAWRLAQISAPATSLAPWRVTRVKLFKRIQKERAAIDHDQALIEDLKKQTLAACQSHGITISAEQIDGLLATAEGGELASVMAVAENIKRIQTALGEHLNTPDTASEHVKTYTGFLMMSFRVYIEAIERAIRTIREHYLVRLTDLYDEANEQIVKAGELSKRSDKASAIARTNIELNAQTLKLISAYRKHLNARIAALETLAKEMTVNFDVALNTFRTVKVGAELIDVIQTSEKDIQMIFNFEPPKLDVLYDENLRHEFDQLTRRLQSKSY